MRATAILVLLLAWHGPTPQQSAQHNVKANSKSDQRPAHNGTPVTRRPGTDHEAQSTSGQAKQAGEQSVRIISAPDIRTESPKDRWDKTLVIATCSLVAVGFLQIALLWSTVSATRDNALAAKQSAEAIVKSERPWILFTGISGQNLEPIEIQQHNPTTVGLTFSNSGRTVAKMTAWKFGLYITGVNAVPPPGVFDTSGLIFKPDIVPKDAPLPHVAQLDGGRIIKGGELRDITENRTSDLWLCGIIRYQDVFDPKTEHLTKVCRRYQVFGTEPMFLLDGPREYNEET